MTRSLCQSSAYVMVILLSAVLWSGCINHRSYTKCQFILDTARPPLPMGPGRDVVLAVRGFTIDPAFDSRGLLYRKGESEYEPDFYNEFLIAPQDLLSSQTRHWLAQSGICKAVLEPGSLVEPTHILEGNVLALYGDCRGRSLPQAVMEIRVFLVANKDSQPQIVFAHDYRASQQAEARTAEALVGAFNGCLEQILTQLEKDLSEVL
jgi:cholesterol transport system auxiliary component